MFVYVMLARRLFEIILRNSGGGTTCLTVAAQDQRGRRALHAALGDGVGHHAGVVAHVRGLHFGDVQIPRLLRDEAAGVLLHEGRVLIEDPGEDQVWRERESEEEGENKASEGAGDGFHPAGSQELTELI